MKKIFNIGIVMLTVCYWLCIISVGCRQRQNYGCHELREAVSELWKVVGKIPAGSVRQIKRGKTKKDRDRLITVFELSNEIKCKALLAQYRDRDGRIWVEYRECVSWLARYERSTAEEYGSRALGETGKGSKAKEEGEMRQFGIASKSFDSDYSALCGRS